MFAKPGLVRSGTDYSRRGEVTLPSGKALQVEIEGFTFADDETPENKIVVTYRAKGLIMMNALNLNRESLVKFGFSNWFVESLHPWATNEGFIFEPWYVHFNPATGGFSIEMIHGWPD